MKCSNCGTEFSEANRICPRCGKPAAQNFNYSNMEKELLHTVMEDENIAGYSGRAFYPQDDEDAEELPKKKRPGRLAASLLACAAAFAAIAFAMQRFPGDYGYTEAESGYLNCLMSFAEDDYEAAGAALDTLLEQDADNLEYLAMQERVAEKTENTALQMKTLNHIIELDADNYPAYEKLLQLYLEEENQGEIAALAERAPNETVYDMLKAYLVALPSFGIAPGVYENSLELTIAAEDGLNIYYTLDGSSPKENGKIYYDALLLEQGHYTVKAVCRNEKGIYGEEISGEYQIGGETGDGALDGAEGLPEVYPESGYYTSPQMITIDVPIGSQAYYSWQAGTDLTAYNGTLYTGGIEMPEGVSTLSVIIVDAYGNSSAVRQAEYTYQPG